MDRYSNPQRPIRVLIAAAETGWKQAYRSTCERLKCEVHRASSGFEALGKLRRERFDVVIGDGSISDLTLFELALYVRDFGSNHTAIVLAGLDASALPATIRRDNKLYSSASRRESLDRLPRVLSRFRPIQLAAAPARDGCCV